MMDNRTGRVLEFRVGDESAGQRLDAFLAARLGELSRMGIASLLSRGACTINDEPARAGRHLASGDTLIIMLDEDTPNSMTAEPLALDIVYEDAHFLVVNKGAGMLVHPTRGVKTGTLANALAYHLNEGRAKADVAPLPLEAGDAAAGYA
ncbi:MAG: hypothetical protein WCD76_19940, partial [Pyrinomonadaceae bacterium]